MTITLRQAFHQAADHIENNPTQYRFFANTIPDCGTQGCMLGWVGHFLGYPVGQNCWEGAQKIIGVSSDLFMDRISGFIRDRTAYAGGLDHFVPTTDPVHAARALRLYAEKYHPADLPIKAKQTGLELALDIVRGAKVMEVSHAD